MGDHNKDHVVIVLPDGSHYSVPKERLDEFKLSKEGIEELKKSGTPSGPALAPGAASLGHPPFVGQRVAHVIGPVPVGTALPAGGPLDQVNKAAAPAGGASPVVHGPAIISGPITIQDP